MSDATPLVEAPETPELTLAALNRAVTDFYTAFPDVNECARKEAARLLKVHTGRDLDPDTIYWHRFSNAISNASTFTGWEHYGVPDKSLTMTELTQRRFDVNDQINAIDLDTMSGFYTQDSTAGSFDQRNELALAPLTIMNALWDTNFAESYKAQLDAFWTAQAEQGRMVAKALCISHAFQAMRHNVLTQKVFKQFIYTLAGPVRIPPAVGQLNRLYATHAFAQVYNLTLGGIAATDILRVTNNQGQQTLFLPPQWFQTFHSEREVYNWISVEAANPERREQLLSHFDAHHQADSSTLDTLNATLDQIQRTPWVQGQTLLNANSERIKQDVFSYLMSKLRTRLEHEAHIMLTSNWDLRKKLFLVNLSAFVRVTAGLAPGDQLVAGVVAGATAISLGAHTAVALHGDTHKERTQAGVAAALDAISLLFSLPMLKGSGKNILNDFVDLAEETPAAIETSSSLSYAVDVDLTSLPTEIDGDGGLFYLSGEKRYIKLNKQVYEVQFIEVLDRWVVINPQTPGNLVGAWPVETNWRGAWEPYTGEALGPLDLETDELLDSARVTPQLAEAHRLNEQLSPYETSARYVELTATLIGRDSESLMSTELDDTFTFAKQELLTARNELAAHARTFFSLPRTPRTVTIPNVSASTTPDAFFENVYDNAYGMVLGEVNDSVGSKKLLIKYMAKLKSLGVHTLYTDFLVKELHQGWVDHFISTGLMPHDLFKYLEQLTHQSLIAKYTPLELLRTARLQGVKVKALDCAAAHQVHGLNPAEAGIGQKMRIYYAAQRIRARQAARPESGWIALVDQTRVSTFEEIPGLSDLTDTLGVRIKDAPRNTELNISPDLGQRLTARRGSLKSDLKIEIGTLPETPDPQIIGR